MTELSLTLTLNAPAADVWNTLRDFGCAARYLTSIKKCTLEGQGVGAVRTLTGPTGGVIVERLDALDDARRTLRYTIVSSPWPIEDYSAEMLVADRGPNQCQVTWSSSFRPKGAPEADVKKMFETIYRAGFDGLRKLHEGK